MENSSPERIRIAKIVGVHGVDGEIKAFPLSDFKDRYESLNEVLVEYPTRTERFVMERVRWHKKLLLIKFKGVDSAGEAEALRDGYLSVGRNEVYPLPEDHFYIFELVGLKVLDSKGTFLGIVVDVLQTGANDVFVVGDADGNEILIPALRKVVLNVDLEAGRMEVFLPPGLVDGEDG